MAAVLTVEKVGEQELPPADITVNGTPMAQLDVDNYQLDLDLTQGQTLTLGGADAFTPAWINPDFFEAASATSVKLVPVTGKYRITANLATRVIDALVLNADGSGLATLSDDGHGAVYFIGYGIGSPAAVNEPGWTTEKGVCVPESAPGIYTMTAQAGLEGSTTLGQRFRVSGWSGKFFRNRGWDGLGAFTLAGKYAPRCERHISTQQSIANYACAQAWYDLGAKRVVLARELSMDEIREIRRRTSPELELETFCHGAMCVSYSGRCLLSNYMTGRDSNRGACAQPCRYQYALMEEKRPGEYFPVFEDEKGTYIMNSRDMCMIDHLDDLMDAGVDCLKIEGRAKSAYYAAIVTGAYRHVIDDVAQGRPADPVWRDEVEHVSHRHYSTGFFYGPPGQYYENSRYIRDWQICAVVTGCTPEGLATLSLRNKFRTGDTVEVVGPDTRPFSLTVPEMTDADGLPLFEPKTPQMTFTMPLSRPVPPMSFIRHAVDLSGK